MDAATEQFVARLRLDADPVANEAAQVFAGNARFTVLTRRLLRLEWSRENTFEDRGSYAFPHRRRAVPSFEHRVDDATTVIDTGALVLRHTPDGRPFHGGNTSIELTGEVAARWTPGTNDAYNLGGARRTVDGCRGEARLETGLVSRSGWALHDDSTGPLFDEDGWVLPRASHGDAQDWYFFGYGHDYAAAITEYTDFGGRMPLVPRWLLGAWWSRYWPYRDSELRELVEDFHTRGFPLDVIVLDMDWHLPGSWTGYSWNRELFPDPPGFLRWLHERGLHTTLNLHPALGVQPFEDAYPAFAAALDIDPASCGTIPFRVADRNYMRHYFELLHHPLEDDGVDFWWMDWQQGRSSGDGVDPLPWLNHVHFKDLERHRDRRPIEFSRWGGLGSHRYPIGFSGDSFATWEALGFQPRYTAAGANVAYGWWSHDIGGHVGPDDPELYVRWVQFGALSPVLRLHSTQDPLAERRPWMFGEQATAAARDAFRMRYELLPYLYTAARHAADTGIAAILPMSWCAPDEDAAYAARLQYLFGPDLIVAPVVHPADPQTGLATVGVWLPAGEWIERTTGERFTGPRWTRQLAELTRVPQFVRAGAVLPLAEVADNTASEPADHLVLSVFPGADGTASVYEDDGTSLAFQDGAYTWTELSVASSDRSNCAVTIAASTSDAARRYTVRFEHTGAPARVLLDGADHDGWYHDGMDIVVDVPSRPRSAKTWVECIDAAVAAPGEDAMAPFVHVYEHTAPDDAAHALGRVVVAGDAATATLFWTYEDGTGVQTFPVEPTAVTRVGVLFDAPFAWDGTLSPARWAVDVTVRSATGTVRERHASATLVPCFASWRGIVSPIDSAPDSDAVLAGDAALDWQVWRDNPADLDYAELTQRCEVGPTGVEIFTEGAAIVDATATLHVVADCDAAFDYWSSDEVVVVLDGETLLTDVTGAAPSAKYDNVREPRRTGTVHLTSGSHRLVVRCTKAARPPWGIWGLGVSAVDPVSGEVLLGVRAE